MSSRLSTIVAGCLGGVLLLSVLSIAILAGMDKTTPGVLENLAAGALGALAALLARVGGEVQPVTVQQPVGQPVPTVEVSGDAGNLSAFEAIVLALLVIIVLLVLGAVG